MRFLLLLLTLFVGMVACSAAPPIDDKGTTIEVVEQFQTNDFSDVLVREWEVPGKHTYLVYSVDNLPIEEKNLYASLATFPQDEQEDSTIVEEELAKPDLTLEDILRVPGKDDPWLNWLIWISQIAVLVIYEIWQRKRPTNKSWAITGILYRFFNMLAKDKGKEGGTVQLE